MSAVSIGVVVVVVVVVVVPGISTWWAGKADRVSMATA